MKLIDILHADRESTCDQTNMTVASHSCLDDHYFVSWNFGNVFTLWHDTLYDDYVKIKDFVYDGPIIGTDYCDAQIIADSYFEEWLESL